MGNEFLEVVFGGGGGGGFDEVGVKRAGEEAVLWREGAFDVDEGEQLVLCGGKRGGEHEACQSAGGVPDQIEGGDVELLEHSFSGGHEEGDGQIAAGTMGFRGTAARCIVGDQGVVS